jgi:hypothetical protein
MRADQPRVATDDAETFRVPGNFASGWTRRIASTQLCREIC